MTISELARRFNDSPLKDRGFLVNRAKELLTLSRLAENYDSSIIGVTGERGSGKTTVLNLFTPEGPSIIKLMVRIEEKDTKLDIIASLLRGLCLEANKEKRFARLKSDAEGILDFLNFQEEKIHLMSVGISHIGKFEKEKGKHRTLRYISSTIKERIGDILKGMTESFKIALCIDEIDKETSKDVVNILDSLKGTLRRQNLVVFVSLPPQIYENFLKDEILLREDYNLDDIFKKMVLLPRLSNEDILEVINSRLGDQFRSTIAPRAKRVLIEYAQGNPRRAVFPVYQALGTKSVDNLPVTENDVLREILPPLKRWVDTLGLTSKQKEIMRTLAKEVSNTTNKSELSDTLLQRGIKRSTVYDNIQRLVSKNILLEEEKEVYRLHPWIKLYLSAQG